MNRRLLDPLDRTSEILFGIIMVLTFTGSISVAEGGEASLRTVLAAAVGCNLAWGLVDASMYLMSTFMERARSAGTLLAIRTQSVEEAHLRLLEMLPSDLASVLTPADIEVLRQRLNDRGVPVPAVTLTRADLFAAAGVFLLVFLSTFPVIVPLLLVPDTHVALRLSNVVAVAMLFILGWSLGRHAERPPWRSGLGMVLIGVTLVAITMAFGG